MISEEQREKQKIWRENNKEWLRNWRLDNKDKLNERSRIWQKENRERAYSNHSKYRKNNRDRINLIAKTYRDRNKEERLSKRRANSISRKNNDPLFKFSENLRSLINISFKRGVHIFKKKTRTEEILGCSIKEFVEYILERCPKGVELKDFGRYGYHLDHIIPISTAASEEEVLKLNHYSNFQPLWWKENLSKSDKILI